MKHLVLAVVISGSLLFAPAPSQAAAPSAAQVDKLMELTDVDSMVDSLYSHVGGLFQRYAQQLQVQESERAIVDKHFEQAVELIRPEINWKSLQPMMRDVYMNHFTAEEVKQLIGFYSSPLGQRLVKKLPQVTRESMGVTQASLQRVMPQVQDIAQRMASEIQAGREGQ